MKIVGVLLAGGHSRRFGSNKLLHLLPDGEPVAVCAARHLLAALPESVAIVRPDNQALAEMLRSLGMQVAFCNEAQQEMGDSLAAAVGFADSLYAADGFVIALADMPFITSSTIKAVADAVASGNRIVIPVYQGRRGHPVGFTAEFREALKGIQGDEGARSIVRQYQTSVVEIEVGDAGIVRDIDHPADLQN
jgi:molybdenum cofactor cytidylyltransferase